MLVKPAEIVKPAGEHYTNTEFEKVLAVIEYNIREIMRNINNIALMTYYCTKLQRVRLKRFLRSYFNGAQVDRFYYYGMRLANPGNKAGMAEHLVLKPIRKATWERLTLGTKKLLNDPESVISVARLEAKPVRKPVADLSGLELNQVLGDNGEIRTPEKQIEAIRFQESKLENKLTKEVPEDGSNCERTRSFLFADNRTDVVLVSANHRQHASLGTLRKFLRDSGFVVYKLGELTDDDTEPKTPSE